MNIWARLSHLDIVRLKNSAHIAQKIETRWDRIIRQAFDSHLNDVAHALLNEQEIPPFNLVDLLIEHSFKVQEEAILYAMKESEIDRGMDMRRLAKPEIPKAFAKPEIPKALKDLRRLYDLWKRGKYKPKKTAAQGERIQKEYLKRIHQTWTELSEDFRKGEKFTQKEVKEKIQEKAEVGASRAQTIVRTETTNFYNKARKDYYDQSKDVTHYLFMAVRDNATTPWCTPKTVDGKRGRHGLVYNKENRITDTERPACHWNCRSEYLPLSPYNPSHKKLIEDESIQRENVTCTPLPKGWRS